MTNLEKDLKLYVISLRLKEKAFESLEKIKELYKESGEKIDGYKFDEFNFKYNRHELHILKESQYTSILARINIYHKENANDLENVLPIGYYDYGVDFNGNFLDDYFVLQKSKIT